MGDGLEFPVTQSFIDYLKAHLELIRMTILTRLGLDPDKGNDAQDAIEVLNEILDEVETWD